MVKPHKRVAKDITSPFFPQISICCQKNKKSKISRNFWGNKRKSGEIWKCHILQTIYGFSPYVRLDFISECCGWNSIIGPLLVAPFIAPSPAVHARGQWGMQYFTSAFTTKWLPSLDGIYYKLGKISNFGLTRALCRDFINVFTKSIIDCKLGKNKNSTHYNTCKRILFEIPNNCWIYIK